MKVRAKLDIDLYNTVKNMKIMTLSFIFRKAKKKKKKTGRNFLILVHDQHENTSGTRHFPETIMLLNTFGNLH